MSHPVRPIPEGYSTLTPYLIVKKAAEAIDFYKRAFGATETVRLENPDGSILHAELQIGDSPLMLTDECPEMQARSPESLGGSATSLFVYVQDVDAAFRRAIEAGATPSMEPSDQFWGDRYGRLVDPFGHVWSLATHIEDVTPEEIRERARTAFAKS